MKITGSTRIAGVVGRPVSHSLSPLLHNAWLEAAGIDGAYVPFSLEQTRFESFIDGMRGGAVRGVNVTLPFKEAALALADCPERGATDAGAANLLLFHEDGTIEARNTDGAGLLDAFAEQAPMFHVEQGPAVILGAGGAARGAAAALQAAGCPEIRIINRTQSRAAELAASVNGDAYGMDQATAAFDRANVIINATSAGLNGSPDIPWPLAAAPAAAVVMDMVYKPLETGLLRAAKARGLQTVDGLAMLIGQARPSFEAFFDAPPPADVDARALLLAALGAAS